MRKNKSRAGGGLAGWQTNIGPLRLSFFSKSGGLWALSPSPSSAETRTSVVPTCAAERWSCSTGPYCLLLRPRLRQGLR